jgi:hypothetical protein
MVFRDQYATGVPEAEIGGEIDIIQYIIIIYEYPSENVTRPEHLHFCGAMPE